MRKTVINSAIVNSKQRTEQEWLNLEDKAQIEVTSEDPRFPVESAFVSTTGSGWRAAENGKQIIRILFDRPTCLRKIRLEFSETEVERTQEFTLRWATEASGPFKEIVRQQWTFSPQGSTSEIENYQLDLDCVSVLELAIKPDLTPDNACATLTKWLMI